MTTTETFDVNDDSRDRGGLPKDHRDEGTSRSKVTFQTTSA